MPFVVGYGIAIIGAMIAYQLSKEKRKKTKIHCVGNSANVGYCTIFIFRNWFNIRSYCRKRMGSLNNVVYLSRNFRNRTYSVIDWYFQEKRTRKRSRSLIKGLLFISTDNMFM